MRPFSSDRLPNSLVKAEDEAKGLLLVRSATNSRPMKKPRPRTSPSASRSQRRSCKRAINPRPILSDAFHQPSRATIRWTATPAAQASVCPVKVWPVIGPPARSSRTAGNSFVIDRCAERHITAGKAFGHGHDIRRTGRGERSPGSATAGTAHHLVGNHDHAMPITDVAHEPRVSIGGRTTPPAAPTTGSKMNAATFRAPRRRISSSNSRAQY